MFFFISQYNQGFGQIKKKIHTNSQLIPKVTKETQCKLTNGCNNGVSVLAAVSEFKEIISLANKIGLIVTIQTEAKHPWLPNNTV